MKILIICDEVTITQSIRAVLEQACHNVSDVCPPMTLLNGITCYSPEGEELIIDAAHAFKPDWVFMFLQGEVTRQTEVAAKSRELKGARLFLFSTTSHAEDLKRARNLGISFHFLQTPFGMDEVLGMVSSGEGQSGGFV